MSLDLLDAPVRLTWDFPENAVPGRGKAVPIARGIRDAGVFYVTLQGYPLLHMGLAEVLENLSGLNCLLVCNARDDELAALARLPSFGGQLMLDITPLVAAAEPFDVEPLAGKVQSVRAWGYEPVVALTPLACNLAYIPELLTFCTQQGVTKFKLPNAHIGDSFHGYSADELPTWEDLNKFSILWAESSLSAETLPTMEIHDLFLWEIMTPGQKKNRSEYGGCQAGNSLAHIDIKGVVHPCSAWPLPLGQLPDQSLEDVWAGRERQAVCEKIALTPVGCEGCSDLNICFGGCRGLAQHLNRSAGERDLMCHGPR